MMIRVTLKDGGIKMLQIQDNGHGISVRRNDLSVRKVTLRSLQSGFFTSMKTYRCFASALLRLSCASSLTSPT
jgi:hypothetical protein